MSKSFFIDTTLCTACRGCQVACKAWHDLPAEKTTNRGTYQNPADLSFDTYKLVRMSEEVIGGQLKWLFFPEQCRHCVEAPCLETAGDPAAIYYDEPSGAVLYTSATKNLDAAEIIESCPYNIPRKGPDGTLAKCDMCYDRVQAGMTMNFGGRMEMMQLAEKRLAAAKRKYPEALLLDPGDVRVIFMVAFDPRLYHEFAVAANTNYGISRQVALKRMLRPLRNLASHLL
jgi:formate dehydrogenase iron-sulfur subunit